MGASDQSIQFGEFASQNLRQQEDRVETIQMSLAQFQPMPSPPELGVRNQARTTNEKRATSQRSDAREKLIVALRRLLRGEKGGEEEAGAPPEVASETSMTSEDSDDSIARSDIRSNIDKAKSATQPAKRSSVRPDGVDSRSLAIDSLQRCAGRGSRNGNWPEADQGHPSRYYGDTVGWGPGNRIYLDPPKRHNRAGRMYLSRWEMGTKRGKRRMLSGVIWRVRYQAI